MLRGIEMREGRTLILCLSKVWGFDKNRTKDGNYTRVSVGFLKIHLLKADLDDYLFKFAKRLDKLPEPIKDNIPKNAVGWMKHRERGLGLNIGVSRYTLSKKPQFDNSALEMIRFVWGRFFIHFAWFDFDRFFAGVLTAAMFMAKYEKISWMFEALGADNEIFNF